jgi:hypothetical protein
MSAQDFGSDKLEFGPFGGQNDVSTINISEPNLDVMNYQQTVMSPIQHSDSPFKYSLKEMPIKAILAETGKFLSSGLSMAITNSANCIVICINFYYIGKLKDATLQASFGLGISYFNFVFFSLCLATTEVTGIQCSKFFGRIQQNKSMGLSGHSARSDYQNITVSLYHGLIFHSIVTLFTIVMF